MVRWVLAMILVQSVQAAGHVRAQDNALPPRDGTAAVQTGFQPDPLVHAVMAGGGEAMHNAGNWRAWDAASGVACGSFYVDEAPNVVLSVGADETTGFSFLRLYVDVPVGSQTDPALIVRQPDGSWRCADDSQVGAYRGLMPIIDIDAPQAGDYAVWVGTYHRNASEPATLVVTAHRANLPRMD